MHLVLIKKSKCDCDQYLWSLKCSSQLIVYCYLSDFTQYRNIVNIDFLFRLKIGINCRLTFFIALLTPPEVRTWPAVAPAGCGMRCREAADNFWHYSNIFIQTFLICYISNSRFVREAPTKLSSKISIASCKISGHSLLIPVNITLTGSSVTVEMYNTNLLNQTSCKWNDHYTKRLISHRDRKNEVGILKHVYDYLFRIFNGKSIKKRNVIFSVVSCSIYYSLRWWKEILIDL